jgi:hypothetical protein
MVAATSDFTLLPSDFCLLASDFCIVDSFSLLCGEGASKESGGSNKTKRPSHSSNRNRKAATVFLRTLSVEELG